MLNQLIDRLYANVPTPSQIFDNKLGNNVHAFTSLYLKLKCFIFSSLTHETLILQVLCLYCFEKITSRATAIKEVHLSGTQKIDYLKNSISWHEYFVYLSHTTHELDLWKWYFMIYQNICAGLVYQERSWSVTDCNIKKYIYP